MMRFGKRRQLALGLAAMMLAAQGMAFAEDAPSPAPAATEPAVTEPAPPASAPAPVPAAPQLTLTRDGDALTIEGTLRDEAARAALVEAVRAVSPRITVTDRTTLSPDIPDAMAAMVPAAGAIAARLRPGTVTLSSRDIAIDGRADGPGALRAIVQAAGNRPAGFALARQQVAPPRLDTFAMSLSRRGDQLIIEGAVAHAEEARDLIAAARSLVPGLTPVDRTDLAEGAPADMDRPAALRFALLQLARLKEGTARLEGRDLILDGVAIDRAGYAAVNLAVRAQALPGGLVLKQAAIRPPSVSPYRWFVERSPAGILIRGYAPSEEARAAARAVVAAHFGTLAVRDEQEIATGAPDNFSDAVVAAVKQLYLLPKGRVTIEDRTLGVAGEVPSEVYANAVRGAVQRLVPAGFAVTHAVTAPPPPPPAPVQAAAPAPVQAPVADTCMPKIREEMAAGGIVFQFGRETMRPESLARLRRIAAILKDCPQTKITVEGHTDSDGIPAQNIDLSQRRAQAVVTLLIREGVAAERLLAEGHGAARPLVANDSLANKARNRRIEFVAR